MLTAPFLRQRGALRVVAVIAAVAIDDPASHRVEMGGAGFSGSLNDRQGK
jgi:hypothetical protein